MDSDGSTDSTSDSNDYFSFDWDTDDSPETSPARSDCAGSGGYTYTPDPIAERERAIPRFPESRERALWNLLNRGGLDVAGTPKLVEETGKQCWRVLNKFGRTARRMTLPELLSIVPESVDEVVINGLAKREVRLDRADIAAIRRMESGWRAEMAVRNSSGPLPAMLDDHTCIAFRSSSQAPDLAVGTVKLVGEEFLVLPLFTAPAVIPLAQYLPPEIRDAGRVEVLGRDLWQTADAMREQIDGIAVNPCDRGILREAPALRLVLPTRMAEVNLPEQTGLDRNGGPICAGLAIRHAIFHLDGIPTGWFTRDAYQRKKAADAAAWLSSVLILMGDQTILPIETARTLKGWRYLRTHRECRQRAWLETRIQDAIRLSKRFG
jgi:hypothetical protein